MIKIGSFNVCNLSQCKKEKLDIIAKIIIKEDFDIVALQEVLGEGKMFKVCGTESMEEQVTGRYLKRLLAGYEIRWGSAQVNKSRDANSGDRRGEGYAFLWKKKTIELPRILTNEGTERIFEPRIWSQYSLKRAGAKIRLIRDPFYGRFKIKRLKQEIRLITTHIRFGKSSGEAELFNESAVKMRNSELRILAGAIYPRLHDKRYGNNTPSTTILLGDYNLNLKLPGSPVKGSYIEQDLCEGSAVLILDENGNVQSLTELYADRNTRAFITKQNHLSTLKRMNTADDGIGDEANAQKRTESKTIIEKNKSDGQNELNTGYANNYDHITYEKNSTEDKVIKECYAIAPRSKNAADAGAQKLGCYMPRVSRIDTDYEEYREKGSDHLPICIEINYRG